MGFASGQFFAHCRTAPQARRNARLPSEEERAGKFVASLERTATDRITDWAAVGENESERLGTTVRPIGDKSSLAAPKDDLVRTSRPTR